MSEVSDQERDVDTLPCECCNAVVPDDQIVSAGEVLMCPECWKAWQEEFAACAHEWETGHFDGDDGRICNRCGGFLSDENFPTMFPEA